MLNSKCFIQRLNNQGRDSKSISIFIVLIAVLRVIYDMNNLISFKSTFTFNQFYKNAEQGPVVRKVVMLSTGYLYPVDNAILLLISLILIHWIVIYPVDSTIQHLNNWNLHSIHCLERSESIFRIWKSN